MLSAGGGDLPTSAPTPLAANEKLSVGLVFDTTTVMDESGALVSAKDAAKRWLQGRSAAEQANQLVGVYATAGEATQIQSPTADTARIIAAIDRVAPPSDAAANEKSALWGSVRLAADALAENRAYQANVVVMTASGDTAAGSRSQASGALADAGASLFAVELTGTGNPAVLDPLVQANGGLVSVTAAGTDIGGLVSEMGLGHRRPAVLHALPGDHRRGLRRRPHPHRRRLLGHRLGRGRLQRGRPSAAWTRR